MTAGRSGPARIGVDLLWLVPGDVGGSEEYAVRTLLAYAAHGPADVRPVVHCTTATADAHPDLGRLLDVEACPVDNRRRARRILAETTWLGVSGEQNIWRGIWRQPGAVMKEHDLG